MREASHDGYLYSGHYDLVTPDGPISDIRLLDENTAEAQVTIQHISPAFLGFDIDSSQVVFNFKSTLAQLGLNTTTQEIVLDRKAKRAEIKVHIHTLGDIAKKMLPLLSKGAYIGKLFAADERRKVRNPNYLARMFGRSDRDGNALLSLGGMHGGPELAIKRSMDGLLPF